MNLINKLCTAWTALKFVRVGLGSLILYSAIEDGQVPGIALGGFFTVFSLFTDGVCCAGGGYYTTIKKVDPSAPSTID